MSPLRYPFVLLDAGGTLFSARDGFGSVYARVLRGHGIDRSAAEWESAFRAAWRAVSQAIPIGRDRFGFFPGGEAEYWRRIVEGTVTSITGSHAGRDLVDRALTELRREFRKPEAWHVYDDVVPALGDLRSLGARLGVVSNWDSRLPALLDGLGLARYMDTIVVSHLEGVEKPDPELFRMALAKLGALPEQAIHVGDTPELDVAGAEAAGIASGLIDRESRQISDAGAIRDLLALPKLLLTTMETK